VTSGKPRSPAGGRRAAAAKWWHRATPMPRRAAKPPEIVTEARLREERDNALEAKAVLGGFRAEL